jgi:predicted aspartyl protease
MLKSPPFLAAFALWLFVSGCATHPPTTAQTPQALSGSRDSFDPILLSQAPTSELPLTNAGNRQWWVRAEIDGQPGVFAVDTGSGTTIITPQFAKKLSAATKDDRFTGRDENGRKILYDRVAYLRLGKQLYLDFYAPILNLDHINRAMHAHIDGILGINVLGKTACTIDWKKNLLTLNTASLKPPADAIPATLGNRRLTVTAQVNGVETPFVLDTGAYCTCLDDSDLARLHIPAADQKQVDAPRIDLIESAYLPQTQARLDSFKLGSINETNFPMMTWKHNLLGMDLLEPYVLTFDARANWISLGH